MPSPAEKLGEFWQTAMLIRILTKRRCFQTLPFLSTLTPFSYGIRPNGTLVDLDDSELITIAENNNVAPVLLVTTLTEDGRFSSENAAAILGSEEATMALANNIIAKLQTHQLFRRRR